MSPPFEILELPAGASVEFKVERWETGWMDIRPRWPGAILICGVIRESHRADFGAGW